MAPLAQDPSRGCRDVVRGWQLPDLSPVLSLNSCLVRVGPKAVRAPMEPFRVAQELVCPR